ncbi:MAG: hydrogenase formation protein HypD [Dehalococcoidia bacterium]|nr:hydrogenase formation protein HypD [Dehalococcoidia bacterium]
MKFVDEFRSVELVRGIVEKLRHSDLLSIRLMEFCGGHTHAILKFGIRQLVPSSVEMLSGPGCPVCVTSSSDVDLSVSLALDNDLILTTFGDMIRVPGSRGSLQQAKAEGADIRIVYSVIDALQIARDNPGKDVVFLGIGFETTVPTVAATVIAADKEGITNFKVLSLHKLCPPIMKEVLDAGEVRLNGIIGPGHVSAVIGSAPYEFIPRYYGMGCVVSGFEPVDILQTIAMLVDQVVENKPDVDVSYRRVVRREGNVRAQEVMNTVFQPADADWRGIGIVKDSGLRIRDEFGQFNALTYYKVRLDDQSEIKGCICGDILRGVKVPTDCRLFGKTCTPEHPVGPCMVSSEGSCAAYYVYGA